MQFFLYKFFLIKFVLGVMSQLNIHRFIKLSFITKVTKFFECDIIWPPKSSRACIYKMMESNLFPNNSMTFVRVLSDLLHLIKRLRYKLLSNIFLKIKFFIDALIYLECIRAIRSNHSHLINS